MLLRALVLVLVAFSANATTRYVTDRAAGPVKWVEWGRAAIERAQKEGRPLFVSIGYAGSYDCQRMHREAFLNGENAEALNAYFVPVLLDRLEYPEVAEAYELVSRTQHATKGWPVNLVLTPALEPFAGGGWMSTMELNRLLVLTANRWASERADVVAEGRTVLNKVRLLGEQRAPLAVDADSMEAVIDAVAKQYEQTKTLDPGTISFLFRYAARTKHENIRTLAVSILRNVASSTRRDQLGGGFHRCADCYEKFLSEQALWALAAIDAWQIAKDRDLAHVARTTLDYVIRDLRPPRGMFDSAQDAHSLVPGQGPVLVEGAFYLWTKDEMAHLLGQETAGKIYRLFGMKEGEQNRLALAEERFLHETRDELAAPLGKLLDVRQKRPEPFREVPMAGWNGLMISALARGAAVFHEPAYFDAATYAAAAVTTKLWNAQKKTLVRTESRTEALGEDYAMLVQGLLDLFEVSSDVKWLDLALTLQQRQDQLFWDASAGRYATGTSLPEMLKGLLIEADDETPSLNALSATNLLRLAALTGNETWRTRPAVIFQSFGGRLRNDGARLTKLAAAYETSLMSPSIVVVTGDPRDKAVYETLAPIYERWEPMRATIFLPHKGVARDRVVRALPFTGALAPQEKMVVTYVCAKGECRRD